MKRIIILLIICFNTQYSLSQDESNKNSSKKETSTTKKDKKNITTSVITLDLSNPHKNSVKHSLGRNKLVVKNRNPLAFDLINGNPYRFRYVLNFQKINLFTNVTFNPSADDLKSDTSIEGERDTDGDGIVDSYDSSPNTPDDPIETIIKIQNDLKQSLSELKTDIDNYISSISNDSKLDIDDFNLRKLGFKNSYLNHIKSISIIEKMISSLNTSDDTIIQNQKDLSTSAESIRLLIEKLLATKANAFLLPIDINGDNIDYVEIQLDIYDGDRETPETYKYKVWIEGGVKIDISGGVHITSLFDSEYYTTDGENNEKLIHKNDNGEYDFGFGTMVNISLRGGSWVRPTLNFGALFTSNQKFQMLAGFGFILGKNERLIVHGGLSMGRVDTLKSNFFADGETSYNLGTDGNVPLDEKFKFGHFFGITYNFSKPKSNKD